MSNCTKCKRFYRLTVTLHQAYIATSPILISRPKANFATSKLLLPFFNVSSASFKPYSNPASIGGGLNPARPSSTMWPGMFRGGHGGKSGESSRRACRWDRREAVWMSRYETNKKKTASLYHHQLGYTILRANCSL